MAILHYIIGLPPQRNGGSVQYALGLIKEQAKREKVVALICGDTLFRGNTSKIKKRKKIGNVPVFALTNPLTPTLIYGTADPLSQYRDIEVDYDNIKRFVESNEIRVLHLHSLMGLHLKIVKYIKNLGVKIVYTSHDFHGICLHYNLINQCGELCNSIDEKKCIQCNLHEPSDRFLRIANSYLYHFLKNIGLFRLLPKPIVQSARIEKVLTSEVEISEKQIKEYKKLIEYYKEYFSLIDKFHFNSSQTKQVFKQFLPNIEGRVIPVITEGIKDRRRKLFLFKEIKFGFIGSLNEYKGFPILRKTLIDLYNEGYNNFKLLTFSDNNFSSDTDCPLIEYHPPYTYSQISEVMYGLDCVIIPSKWYETFSLVALEALAHGRPVVISDHVGAKDIIRNYNPEMIFNDIETLRCILKDILDKPDTLLRYNDIICAGRWNYSIENHAKELIDYYDEQ